ncbi:hypothetical protein [Bacillus sp. AK031]
MNNLGLMVFILLLGVIVEFIGTRVLKHSNKRKTFPFIVWGGAAITFMVLWFLEN